MLGLSEYHFGVAAAGKAGCAGPGAFRCPHVTAFEKQQQLHNCRAGLISLVPLFCRWSNLVQPASAALQLTSNSSSYADSQLSPSRRRALLSSCSSSSEQAAVADWLTEHSRQHGSYRSASAAGIAVARSSAGDGSLAFSSAGTASNGSLVEGLTNALIMTGTSRWPNAYTARQLQLSIIVLFVVVVAASCLQLAAIGLWKLLKLNSDDLPK